MLCPLHLKATHSAWKIEPSRALFHFVFQSGCVLQTAQLHQTLERSTLASFYSLALAASILTVHPHWQQHWLYRIPTGSCTVQPVIMPNAVHMPLTLQGPTHHTPRQRATVRGPIVRKASNQTSICGIFHTPNTTAEASSRAHSLVPSC